MHHKLRILLLKHLNHRPRSGYGLIREINEATGWKPSYGSVYPQLEQLHKEGLVTCKEQGKKKVYTLTQKGEKEAKEFTNHHADMLRQLREHMKLMSHMCGFDNQQHDDLIDLYLSAIEQGKAPFKEVMDSATKMKLVFWQLYERGALDKHKKRIDAIMERATKELQELT